MKRTAAVLVALLAPSFHAVAADIVSPPPMAPPSPVVAANFDWSGFYVGALGGYHWSQADPNSFRIVEDELSVDNWLGGAFVGANYQFGNNLLIGLEGEFDYLGGSGMQPLDVVIANKIETAEGELELGWGGSLRARFGYGFEKTMLYATGGGEVVSGRVKGSFGGKSIDTKTRELYGWTVGAGLEHAFTDNIFARAEYRYTYFPKVHHSFHWDKDFSMTASQNRVQVGLGYKF